MTNTNPTTGIAYGYISSNALHPDTVHELMYGMQATDHSYDEALGDYLATARNHADADELLFDEDAATEEFAESYESYEPSVSGILDGVSYPTSWLGRALNFWSLESPHTGLFAACSPCVPGAADLDHPDAFGTMGYDVPATWRTEQ